MKKIHIAALCGAFIAGIFAMPVYESYDNYQKFAALPESPDLEESCKAAKKLDNETKDLAVNSPEIAEMMIREKPDTNFQTRYIIEGECRCPN